MRPTLTLLAAFLASACGPTPTPNDTVILTANVEETDVPPDIRRTLVGVITREHELSFPDGEVDLELEVAHGRATDIEGDDEATPDGPRYLRSIVVRVANAEGYAVRAELIGMPTNRGSNAEPVHTRLVQVTRERGGLTGSSTAQMTLQITPETADAI